jgi:small subunit ribosomal protein S21
MLAPAPGANGLYGAALLISAHDAHPCRSCWAPGAYACSSFNATILEPGGAARLQVLVRDNNVDQALKALKKKMQREGIFREMKLRNYYEKPSERRVREKAEAVRRARKLARKKLQREGLLPSKPAATKTPGRGGPGRCRRWRQRRRCGRPSWRGRRFVALLSFAGRSNGAPFSYAAVAEPRRWRDQASFGERRSGPIRTGGAGGRCSRVRAADASAGPRDGATPRGFRGRAGCRSRRVL